MARNISLSTVFVSKQNPRKSGVGASYSVGLTSPRLRCPALDGNIALNQQTNAGGKKPEHFLLKCIFNAFDMLNSKHLLHIKATQGQGKEEHVM